MSRRCESDRTITVTVDGQDASGAGIVHAFGKKILVTGLIAGERAVIHVKDPREVYPEAEVRRIVSPAPTRVEPRCPVFGRCGGCTLQMLDYEAQREWKRRRVREAIRRALEDRSVRILPVIGMSDPWRYRNKVQYPVGASGKFPLVGFYAPVSYRIVPNRGCPIQHPEADLLKEILVAHMETHRIAPYDERKGTGLVRYLMTRKGDATGEVLGILVLNGAKLPAEEAFVAAARAAIPNLVGVVVNVNTRRTRVILGPHNRLVWGKERLTDRLLDCSFEVSPNAFYQVNHTQTETLYRTVLSYAALGKSDRVFDLYTGIGTLAVLAARMSGGVWGVDISAEAIADAKRNAALNRVDNIHFVTGDVTAAVSSLLGNKVIPDVIILDPPRAGCSKPLLAMLAAARPRRIVYVSCDPETLARDLGILEAHGFIAREVQPVDLFPHTGHIEAVALIEPGTKAVPEKKPGREAPAGKSGKG